jgi:two-component system sensor histidine kinase QseC
MKAVQMPRRPTIRRQITRRLLLAFGVPLVIAGVSGYAIIRANLLARLDGTLLAKAEAIVSVTTWDDGRLHVDASAPFMREFAALTVEPEREAATARRGAGVTLPVALRRALSVFQVVRTDGTVIARSASLEATGDAERFARALAAKPVGAVAGTGRTPASLPASLPTFWDITLPSGGAGRALAFPFVPHMPREGTAPGPIDAILLVAIDRQDLDRTLGMVAAVFWGVGVLLAAAIAIAVSTGLRGALAPLDTLAEQASRIDADSLATRFPIAGLPGELRPIADRLNALLSRLERSFDRERQFSADVAHELRTPIAELRTGAELALKWPDARKSDADRETLAIATQMEGVVVRLLALLRSERGQLPIVREPLAFAAIVRRTWETMAARAAARHLDVTWEMEDDVQVEADPVLVRSILTNVMDNAVEYTPPGGAIRIRLTRAAGEAPETHEARFRFSVANTVDALTDDDVTKLFERFWRRDAARSSSEHSGLGLSLARAFAAALEFDLTADLTETQQSDDRVLVITLFGRASLVDRREAYTTQPDA